MPDKDSADVCTTRPLSVEQRRTVELRVAMYRVLYASADEPLAVWAAYNLCRAVDATAGDFPVAPWILEALDQVGQRLFQPFIQRRSWKDHVLSAMGFVLRRGGGRSNPFATSGKHELAMLVRVHIESDGLNVTNACLAVANEFGVSESTVTRAWERYASAMRVEDLEKLRADVDGVRHDIRKTVSSETR